MGSVLNSSGMFIAGHYYYFVENKDTRLISAQNEIQKMQIQIQTLPLRVFGVEQKGISLLNVVRKSGENPRLTKKIRTPQILQLKVQVIVKVR